MEFKEFFVLMIGVILTVVGYFVARWINRIDEDRKAQERRYNIDSESINLRLQEIQRDFMVKTEAQKWITRLDRDIERLEHRIQDLERSSFSKIEVISIIKELKKDVNLRLSDVKDKEIRVMVTRMNDQLIDLKENDHG